jgi:phage-related protein
MYCSKDKESVSDFISRSDPKIKKKYEFLLRFIADETNQLKEPYVKHFSIERFKQFYELRLKAAKTMIRIIYYKADENIILLHAFNKRDKRDTEHALEYALKIVKTLDDKALNPVEKLVEVEIH